MSRYLVILMRKAHVDPAAVSAHRNFLADLHAQGRNEMHGPFGDGSGGAYLLRANDLDEALAIVQRDPASISGGWEITVREWQTR